MHRILVTEVYSAELEMFKCSFQNLFLSLGKYSVCSMLRCEGGLSGVSISVRCWMDAVSL